MLREVLDRMEDRDLGIRSLARASGTHHNQVHRLVHGGNITTDALWKILDALNINI